jgi:valyl-tRNA synthetase
MKLDPKKKVAAEFSSSAEVIRNLIDFDRETIMRFAALSDLKISANKLPATGGSVRSTLQFDVRIDATEAAAMSVNARVIDASAELARIRKEIERVTKDIASKERQLGDETFRSRAPEKIIRGMEATLEERRVEVGKLRERLGQFEGGAKPA